MQDEDDMAVKRWKMGQLCRENLDKSVLSFRDRFFFFFLNEQREIKAEDSEVSISQRLLCPLLLSYNNPGAQN